MTAVGNPLTDLGEAINAERLKNDGFAEVQRVFWVPRTDSTGEHSLFIYLILSGRLKERELDWNHLEPLVRVVRERARAHLPPEVFPYIRVMRDGNVPKNLEA